MPIAIRRILQISRRQSFPKGITEFEIREFFTLSDVDLQAIRVDSNRKPRLARPAGWISTHDERMNESRIALSSLAGLVQPRGHRNGTRWYAVPLRPLHLAEFGIQTRSFVGEAIVYHRLLMRVGVPTELHVLPTAFHGSESIVSDAWISVAYCQRQYATLKRALADAR
jgi:hypothetical protein